MSGTMEEASIYAQKYLEDMLSFFGLNTDVHATVNEDDIIELHVPSTHLNGFLIGARGETIRAIQFMVSNALRSQGFEQSRVHVDIADYKKQRAEQLTTHAQEWVNKVKESKEPKVIPLILINAVHPHLNDWKIKARLIHKSTIRQYNHSGNQGKVFSIDILDKSKSEIQCSFFNEAVDIFYDNLIVGHIYEFSKGTIRENKGNFK